MTLLVHHRLRALIVGGGGFLFLGLLAFPLPVAVVIADLILWSAFLIFLFLRVPTAHRMPGIAPLLGVTSFSLAALLGIVEWMPAQWCLVVCGALLLGWISHHAPEGAAEPAPVAWRQTRRLLASVAVVDVAALAIVLFSIDIFFPHTPILLLSILFGGVAAAGAMLIWRLYDAAAAGGRLPGALFLGFAMGELAWGLHLLPFGYAGRGAVFTFVWYAIVRFARFHMSPQGIEWRRQRLFLSVVAILLFFLIFFFLRWI